jgi:hypothetical protein
MRVPYTSSEGASSIQKLSFLIVLSLLVWRSAPDRLEIKRFLTETRAVEDAQVSLERRLASSRSPAERAAAYRALSAWHARRRAQARAVRQAGMTPRGMPLSIAGGRS